MVDDKQRARLREKLVHWVRLPLFGLVEAEDAEAPWGLSWDRFGTGLDPLAAQAEEWWPNVKANLPPLSEAGTFSDLVNLTIEVVKGERSKDADSVVDAILDRLCAQHQPFRCATLLGAPSPLLFDWAVPAANDLRIVGHPTHALLHEEWESLSPEDKASLLRKTGPEVRMTVLATSVNHARKQFEAKLQLLVGGLYATGLAHMLPVQVGLARPLMVTDQEDSKSRVPLSPEIQSLVTRTSFQVYAGELGERHRLERDGVSQVLGNRLRYVWRLLLAADAGVLPEALERALRLMAQAIAADNEGLAIALAAMSFEAGLLEPPAGREKQEETKAIQARLKEAVAYYLGRDTESRREWRKKVRDVYKARSDFVHQGKIPDGDRRKALAVARAVVDRLVSDFTHDSKPDAKFPEVELSERAARSHWNPEN